MTPWQEFKNDCKHPGQFFRGAYNGAMGRDPELPTEMRVAGFLMVGLGLSQMILGVCLILA